MTKNENKTKATTKSFDEFVAGVPEPMQADARTLATVMQDVTGEQPVMWGSIVGFGSYHYKYPSGREGDWMKVGFSPRKNAITLYLTYDTADFEHELTKLGKHTVGKGCVYVKRLEDIDQSVLRGMIEKAYNKSEYSV